MNTEIALAIQNGFTANLGGNSIGWTAMACLFVGCFMLAYSAIINE